MLISDLQAVRKGRQPERERANLSKLAGVAVFKQQNVAFHKEQ